MKPLRILGIDPGSRKMGWGIIDVCGSRIDHVASATFAPKDDILCERLVQLAINLEETAAAYAPHVAAIEDIFFAKNVASALTLGHARGAIMLSLRRLGLVVHPYSALQIKQATTGRGHAGKAQVQSMIRLLLRLPPAQAMGSDTSDALAVALCHAQRGETWAHAAQGRHL